MYNSDAKGGNVAHHRDRAIKRCGRARFWIRRRDHSSARTGTAPRMPDKPSANLCSTRWRINHGLRFDFIPGSSASLQARNRPVVIIRCAARFWHGEMQGGLPQSTVRLPDYFSLRGVLEISSAGDVRRIVPFSKCNLERRRRLPPHVLPHKVRPMPICYPILHPNSTR